MDYQSLKAIISTSQVKFRPRRLSLPQSYLPSRNLGPNQLRQPLTSPFSFTSHLSSSDSKQRNKDSPVLPPYGLCCQLTAVKAQDESSDPVAQAKEDKPRGEHVAQCNGLDSRHVQMRRSVYCPSTSKDKEQQRWKRNSIATTGGKELLKSINDTLGKLMEVQEKTEPVKTHGQENLLSRSRLPPATLNGPLKRETPIEGVKLSLIQENVGEERVKERRNPGLKISCSVKDSHSHKPQALSRSNSTREQSSNREKHSKLGPYERATRRRRRRTIENKVPITANNDALSKLDESASSRRHLLDDKKGGSHETPP